MGTEVTEYKKVHIKVHVGEAWATLDNDQGERAWFFRCGFKGNNEALLHETFTENYDVPGHTKALRDALVEIVDEYEKFINREESE